MNSELKGIRAVPHKALSQGEGGTRPARDGCGNSQIRHKEHNGRCDIYKYSDKLKSRSQQLRKDMTKEERKLWYEFLRGLPLRIHRQKMIGSYILDFYCASCKIGIELDGSQHYQSADIEYDKKRSEYLKNLGITVLRYSNLDVNKNFSGVCEDIMRKLGLTY